MYLVGRSGGFAGQERLWEAFGSGIFKTTELTDADLQNVQQYWKRFKDVPCDFADASLLAVAQRLQLKDILTLDRHFYAYRVEGEPLNLVIHP